MKDLISIIIPIYKVELYIDKCIESILNQTWKNIEVILVDDGSPDKCGQICDEYAKKDTRIKVIHKENGGLSDARNAGVEVATGNYIGFIDSDDWIDENFYEQLIDKIKKTGVDIVAAGVKKVWEDGKMEVMTPYQEIQLSNQEAMKAIIEESFLKQPVWYKLYRADVARVKFKRGVLHEDNYWSYQVIAKANKVVAMPEPYYYYLQRSNSIMSSQYSEKRLAGVDAKIERQQFLIDNYPELVDVGYVDILFSSYYQGVQVINSTTGKERKNLLNKINKMLIEYDISKEGYKNLKFTHKIWYHIAKMNFGFACKIRKNLIKA